MSHAENPPNVSTQPSSGDPAVDFISVAVEQIGSELGTVDERAMRTVMLLHRVTNMVVYDLESSIHRPAGWSWAAFRLLFTLWMGGPLESRKAAESTGMSRQAVSALSNTLESEGLLSRKSLPEDGRAVLLSLTEEGRARLAATYLAHNEREQRWSNALNTNEQSTLIELLSKLASAGQESWVSHRF
jgi:DNA-binding MarR family transcriptional regulator